MIVAPYVFQIRGDPKFNLNFEVDEAIWTALEPMREGRNHTIENRQATATKTAHKGYRLEGGHFVWGLTYRMMQSFFKALNSDCIRKD